MKDNLTSLYLVLDEHYTVLRGGPFASVDHALKYIGPLASNEELYIKCPNPIDPRPIHRFTTDLPGFPVIDVGYRVDDKQNIDLAYVNYCKIDVMHDLREGLRAIIIRACLINHQKHLTASDPSLPSAQ